MYIKIIAIIIIILSCTYFGFYYGENFKRRNIQLNQFLKSIYFLNNEVMYSHTPLPEALKYVSIKLDNSIGKLLEAISKKLIDDECASVYDAYLKEYQNYKSEFYLKGEDERIIEDFFKSLGETGIYGQDKVFNITIENLKMNCKVAKDMAEKNIKMYRALGLSIGIMIVIIFI